MAVYDLTKNTTKSSGCKTLVLIDHLFHFGEQFQNLLGWGGEGTGFFQIPREEINTGTMYAPFSVNWAVLWDDFRHFWDEKPKDYPGGRKGGGVGEVVFF